jgi:hypothetical protein
MLSTAPASLVATAARLRSGVITQDYAPGAVAELIEALAREKREAAAHIEELEQLATPAAARNAYARGWREAQGFFAAELTARGYPDIAEEFATLSPVFAEAGRAAQGAAA